MTNVANQWQALPANRKDGVPLIIGLEGPPGGGKTVSSLLLAQGMQDVFGLDRPIVVIDTENRSNKYAGVKIGDARPFEFLRVDFQPPFRANRYLEAFQAQIPLKPSAIIIDTMSDEHEGEGGRIEWQAEELDTILTRQNSNKPNYDPRLDWAGRLARGQDAYRPSSEARKKMINTIARLKPCPVIMNFRAREKTAQIPTEKNGRVRVTPTNIGYQPIAPADIVHQVDIMALLPLRADGVPQWRSAKSTEEFVLKLPEQFRGMFHDGHAITPGIGAALARWQRGDDLPPPAASDEKITLREPETMARRSPSGDVLQDARVRAAAGYDVFNDWFTTIAPADQAKVRKIEPELQRLFDDYDARLLPGER